ncbi:MAG: hypothetical protein HY287_10635 [Planctomycetes bacterium]|nr:hypothetical protein [Planctomycetota bacterium]
MRLGILTSTETRHRYFVNALRARFDVVAVGYEDTGYSPANLDGFDLNDDERRIVEHHFAERERQEERFFGADAKFVSDSKASGVLHIPTGHLNTESTLEFFESRGVDAVAVYGTNLIKRPLIHRWPGRIFNLHLGLSPYYRGTGTNFYPLLNEEPEYVGATILLLDEGIDTGPIMRHARPTISPDDMPHTLGCKAILAGIETMMGVLADVESGRPHDPVKQWKPANAKLYLRKDYHPRQVVEMNGKWNPRMIAAAINRNGPKLIAVTESLGPELAQPRHIGRSKYERRQ